MTIERPDVDSWVLKYETAAEQLRLAEKEHQDASRKVLYWNDELTHNQEPQPEKKEEVMKPDETLKQLAILYNLKNSLYGDSYKQAGHVLTAMFPKGLTLNTDTDFNRFCILVHIVTKMLRYGNNFDTLPDEDHMKDISVYASMLLELDQEDAK